MPNRTHNRDPQLSFLPGEGGVKKDAREPTGRTGKHKRRPTPYASISERIRGAAEAALDKVDLAEMIKDSLHEDFLGTLNALAKWRPAEVHLSGNVTLVDEFTEILRNVSNSERAHADRDDAPGQAVASLSGDVRH